MLIDWFTVIAQIINFLILVFLLWRFLYKPILKTIDERQRRIDQRWQDAEDQQQQAEQEAADYRQRRRELDDRQQQILAQAKEDAEADRKQRLHQARQEIESLKQQWQEALQREQESFLTDLRSQVEHQVYAITRRILNDLADQDLEDQAVQTFQRRLRDLDASQKQDLQQAVHDSSSDVLIRSSFELSQETRQQLVQTVKSQLDLNGNGSIQFDVDQDLILGIELQAGGQSLAWNVDHYLQQLEQRLSKAMHQQQQSQHKETEADQSQEEESQEELQKARSQSVDQPAKPPTDKGYKDNAGEQPQPQSRETSIPNPIAPPPKEDSPSP